MPNYNVSICFVVHARLEVNVEAGGAEAAVDKAEEIYSDVGVFMNDSKGHIEDSPGAMIEIGDWEDVHVEIHDTDTGKEILNMDGGFADAHEELSENEEEVNS